MNKDKFTLDQWITKEDVIIYELNHILDKLYSLKEDK